ncbi:MAG: ferredoxin--NADP+ reductase [Candidatus Azotimanducaceae bacterium]|jgi:ferredoxin--NADP+ reductase
MVKLGSIEHPLRVAIIGAGPSGLYTISNFLKHKELSVELDLFDRLPTPYGLVRAGVAPDHQKDKSVTRAYAKSLEQPNVRFFGNVEYGKHIFLADLQAHYHQIIFTNGASTDRDLGIAGEDLAGSYSATDFVAWYNGHPDYAHHQFDLTQERVAIVGVGNVAMDVARILCKSVEELQITDIADHALQTLQHSRVKQVYLLGRRGPAQAAFTPPEIKELGELAQADIVISADDARVDALSQAAMAAHPDKNVEKNVGFITEYSQRPQRIKNKLLTLRFLVSPTEILGASGKVTAIKLMRNEIYDAGDGAIRPRATGVEEVLPVGLVFRSVGYQGMPVEGIPFDARSGTISHEHGRVVSADGQALPGLYTAGWIKRGPTGVIGTNKTCAQETVGCMVEDLQTGQHFNPSEPSIAAIETLIKTRQPRFVTYEDWLKIDAAEIALGEAQQRPRVKFVSVDAMLDIAGC